MGRTNIVNTEDLQKRGGRGGYFWVYVELFHGVEDGGDGCKGGFGGGDMKGGTA